MRKLTDKDLLAIIGFFMALVIFGLGFIAGAILH